ncbi:MAG: lipoprotein-releasing ABC transporter permease subunit [candidate division KSB1 bacterium]|nr:lipoprotein-releasing ABC transporter permease subunit [candidate division KSB1 bacterium]MDZ7364937.1 lipoprotein-releasing ABC transporter permease subunit [candidate division KSB1 bacterium]MDZ7403332.1 lipoprotein-releasing ABC transporter permease subunit [candidate division KSB1 bacterium]
MSYEFFIAKRYLRSKRQVKFISLITYISIIGVMIGAAALIIVLSVMNGFESEVRSRIIGFDAHLKLRTFYDRGVENYPELLDKVKGIPHIVAAAPFILDKAMIISRERKEGAQIKAIDPNLEAKVTDFVQNVNYGTLNLGLIEKEGERAFPGIIIGFSLADRLGVGLGDRVQLLSAAGIDVGGFGSMPTVRTFRVAGYFQSGLYEYDDNVAFISIPEAQRLFEMGSKVNGIQFKLTDMALAREVAEMIKERVGGYPYTTVTWFDTNKTLFAWMQYEKWIAFIVLSLIILVAAFNIVSTQIMVVLEKTKEIGILKSMGASNESVMRIFIYQGAVAGVIGAVLGVVISYLLCWAQIKFKFFELPPDVYIISALPILMKPLDFILVAGAAFMISLTATIYPAYRAAKLDPVQAIRYK